MKRTIIQSEWFNALYEDDVLVKDGKPEYLNAETMARLYPEADIYFMKDETYDLVLAGAGYPQNLLDLPLGPEYMDKIR